MKQDVSKAGLHFDSEKNTYHCQGSWSAVNLTEILQNMASDPKPHTQDIVIAGDELDYFDSAGALAIQTLKEHLKNKNITFKGFSKKQHALMDLVAGQTDAIHYVPPPKEEPDILYKIGKETIEKLNQAKGALCLIGDLSSKLAAASGHWKRFRFSEILSIVDTAGLQALPIVALLSFLIGVVLAYQMGLQLQTYGANIFIAYLSGLAIFREFSPLITAIIVAGRTSSAFTAQLGSMKINEEIDALSTMGLSPTELLVMPKVIGLTFIFPLLIFWSDFFGIIGAMIMSKGMLGVGYYDFLIRLQDSVGFKQMMLGLYKAPAFSLIIALVGCYQGFAVQATADSIGSQTTRSVVQALFLIIIADAAFSIVYSWMDL